jgi:hypothetical protein
MPCWRKNAAVFAHINPQPVPARILVGAVSGSRTTHPITKGRDISASECPCCVTAPEDLFKLPTDKVAAAMGNKTAIPGRAYRLGQDGANN